jgi:peptidoglycan/xylan/chitin deacetylase (PgdA/CDA1 family)
LYVSEARLRSRFELLRELGATVLSLTDAIGRLAEGTLPPASVVLTFDDGDADFAIKVVPLLREFGYPATVYVTTHYLYAQRPIWQVMAKYVLWAAPPLCLSHVPLDLLAGPITSGGNRMALSAAFERRWMGQPSEAQDNAVSRLATALDLDEAVMRERRMFYLMTPGEVQALPRDLVSVQLHTHRHRQPLERSAYEQEIRRNRELIEDLTGLPAQHFCYPSGVVEPPFPGYLRGLGVESAVTCEPGLASIGSDPWRLPRLVDTMNTPLHTFRAWVAGTMGWLKRS